MSMSSHHSRTFDATVEAAIAIGSEDVLVYGDNDDGNWQIANVMPRQVPRVTIPAPYRNNCAVALLGGKLAKQMLVRLFLQNIGLINDLIEVYMIFYLFP